jgi:hypothetical protein
LRHVGTFTCAGVGRGERGLDGDSPPVILEYPRPIP